MVTSRRSPIDAEKKKKQEKNVKEVLLVVSSAMKIEFPINWMTSLLVARCVFITLYFSDSISFRCEVNQVERKPSKSRGERKREKSNIPCERKTQINGKFKFSFKLKNYTATWGHRRRPSATHLLASFNRNRNMAKPMAFLRVIYFYFFFTIFCGRRDHLANQWNGSQLHLLYEDWHGCIDSTREQRHNVRPYSFHAILCKCNATHQREIILINSINCRLN